MFLHLHDLLRDLLDVSKDIADQEDTDDHDENRQPDNNVRDVAKYSHRSGVELIELFSSENEHLPARAVLEDTEVAVPGKVEVQTPLLLVRILVAIHALQGCFVRKPLDIVKVRTLEEDAAVGINAERNRLVTVQRRPSLLLKVGHGRIQVFLELVDIVLIVCEGIQLLQILYKQVVQQTNLLSAIQHEIDIICCKVREQKKNREDRHDLHNKRDNPRSVYFPAQDLLEGVRHARLPSLVRKPDRAIACAPQRYAPYYLGMHVMCQCQHCSVAKCGANRFSAYHSLWSLQQFGMQYSSNKS